MKKHMLAKRMGAIALCAVLSTGLLSATAAAQGRMSPRISPPICPSWWMGPTGPSTTRLARKSTPSFMGGTTYLPIRAIGELMGKM